MQEIKTVNNIVNTNSVCFSTAITVDDWLGNERKNIQLIQDQTGNATKVFKHASNLRLRDTEAVMQRKLLVRVGKNSWMYFPPPPE